MKKTIITVFIILACLLLAFVVWDLFFNDNGIIQTGYNAVAASVNNTWESIAGANSRLLPQWGSQSASTSSQKARKQGTSSVGKQTLQAAN